MRRQGNPGYTRYDAEKAWKREFGDVAELQKEREAIIARQGAQKTGLTTQQQYEKMQWTTGVDLRTFMANSGGPTQAAARAREIEQMRVRHEQEMGGPEGSATRLKEGTEEYIKLHRAQLAEETAEGYEDELRKYKDDAVEKGRIQDEITAKQKALAVQQTEERRQERVGIIEQMLRAPGVGGQFADEADRLALQEMERKRRREHPEMAADLDKLDAAERAEMAAQQNWKPSEVASRKGAWDAGRPSGYDRFMPGQTPEAKALQEYLSKNYNTLEKIAGMLAALGQNIGVASPTGASGGGG